MKKFCHLALSAIIAFIITSALNSANIITVSTAAQKTNSKKPFGLAEGLAGEEIKKVETKIEVAAPAASRGSIKPAPDKEANIKIKVYIAEKKQIKEMNLEEYIAGVVSGEMPPQFHIEALKAQAVAARTYAVTRMKAFSGKGCSNNPNSDICTDPSHCQAWKSNVDQNIKEAVKTTQGLILSFNSQPVMYPLFFSTSSGRTENSQDVFSGEYPYLKSVPSPYEEEAPKYLTKTTVSINQFVKKFNGYGAKLNKAKLPSQIKILSRTEGGSVKIIQIGSKNFSGTEVRRILNLNSANFNMDFTNDSVILTVAGFGHGVGMSQWGANEMGKRGSTYDEILKHYYTGIDIVPISDILK